MGNRIKRQSSAADNSTLTENRQADTSTEETVTEESSTEPENASETISLGIGEQDTSERPRRGRGRPRKEGNNESVKTRSTKTAKAPSKEDKDRAKTITAKFMETAEKFGSEATGKDASFSDFERTLIEPSLTNILADVNTSAFDRYGKILNPLVLLFGLFIWFFRIQPKEVKRNVNPIARPVAEESGVTGDGSENSYQYPSQYDSTSGNLFT